MNNDNQKTIANFDKHLNYELAKLANEVYMSEEKALSNSTADHERRLLLDEVELKDKYGEKQKFDDRVLLSFCEKNKSLLLSFRGTKKGSGDIFTDLSIQKHNFTVDGQNAGKVHSGFYHLAISLQEKVDKEINEYYGKVCDIHISGHSLGGALSVLYASLSSNKIKNKIRTITTFGQPKVGDINFAQWFNSVINSHNFNYYQHINKYYRIIDPITYIPIIGYHHANGIRITGEKGKPYEYNSNELFVDSEKEDKELDALLFAAHKMDLYEEIAKYNTLSP